MRRSRRLKAIADVAAGSEGEYSICWGTPRPDILTFPECNVNGVIMPKTAILKSADGWEMSRFEKPVPNQSLFFVKMTLLTEVLLKLPLP